jgi:hypothetical protein
MDVSAVAMGTASAGMSKGEPAWPTVVIPVRMGSSSVIKLARPAVAVRLRIVVGEQHALSSKLVDVRRTARGRGDDVGLLLLRGCWHARHRDGGARSQQIEANRPPQTHEYSPSVWLARDGAPAVSAPIRSLRADLRRRKLNSSPTSASLQEAMSCPTPALPAAGLYED